MNQNDPMTRTPLSPAAQAVEDAYFNADGFGYRNGLAAALRAAADQVVPEEMDLPPIAPDLGHFRQHERRLTRRQLLAIAAELEGSL
jgi:hypothetical protein